MATLFEKKQLEILLGLQATIQQSNSAVLTSIQSLDINVSNEDVVQKLTLVNTTLNSLIAAVNSKSPIIKSGTVKSSEILSAAIPALTSVRLFTANPNRIGFTIYNNSTNSLYVGPSNSPAGGKLFFQLASNAGPTAAIQCFGPSVWTGEIWVLRNSGTGGVTGYEFEA